MIRLENPQFLYLWILIPFFYLLHYFYIRTKKKKLKKFAEQRTHGNLKNEPIKNKGKSPCTYCDYKTICNFDKELGNRFKYINELKNEEVFEQIKMF
mgnify:CR=1 FL=1